MKRGGEHLHRPRCDQKKQCDIRSLFGGSTRESTSDESTRESASGASSTRARGESSTQSTDVSSEAALSRRSGVSLGGVSIDQLMEIISQTTRSYNFQSALISERKTFLSGSIFSDA